MGQPRRDPLPVAWDEAREVLVVVLVAAAGMHLLGPAVRWFAVNHRLPRWDELNVPLNNVDSVTGLLVLGASVVVCTTPGLDVVPRLRSFVRGFATSVTAVAGFFVVQTLTSVSAGDTFFARFGFAIWRPGPALLLAATAAWLADRVVTFPSGPGTGGPPGPPEGGPFPGP